MKASDYIAGFLAAQGVPAVFELTGGMITHLLDSLHRQGEVAIVSVHHEQAAAFAAEGAARMTGVPGIAMATSGPGATNLLTGIGSCYFDSVPAVFITGQVNTHELRGDSGVRQAGFQETDIVAVASPLTKAAWQVANAEDIPEAMRRAFHIALEGRPGPVLLDIPMDVQRQEVRERPGVIPLPGRTPPGDISEVLEMLARAERPLLLAGGGVRTAGAAAAVRQMAERLSIPVACTLMAVDVLPAGHPLRVGFIGTYGNRWANLALRDADCLVTLGARLDVRQTGADTDTFAAGKAIIRVDIDPAQRGWRVAEHLTVCADVGLFAAAVLDASAEAARPRRDGWLATVEAHRAANPEAAELIGIAGVDPATLMRALSLHAAEALAFVVDVGQNQMWAAQSLALREGQRFLTSGGMGAMGFALPAAIGVATAVPDRPVVVVTGDGGIQINLQEFETIVRLGLPVKTVVVDNRCLGMVRQFQDELFESRYQSTVWGYGTPEFVAVAEAFGMSARKASTNAEVETGLAWLFADASPALLHVEVDTDVCVRPKVSFGNAVYVMDPPPTHGALGD